MKIYKYSKFPKMDPKLYVKIQKPMIKYQSRFEVAKDEVKKLTKIFQFIKLINIQKKLFTALYDKK